MGRVLVIAQDSPHRAGGKEEAGGR